MSVLVDSNVLLEDILRHVRTCTAATAALLAAATLRAAEVRVWDQGYPPPPEPAQSRITLGAYVFPGWYRDKGKGDYPYKTHDEDSEWRQVAKRSGPRPLLGFYDDSLPEVNDWHIKWALEHGISFFCFDWYWNAGEHRLLRTLERGFLKAKYCEQMKFCVHWCNHGLDWHGRQWNRPLDEDFQTKALVELTEYLADRYFGLPNYLTIEGRPVFLIWDVARVVKANGGPSGFARALGEMNAVLRARGLKDIYLVAVHALKGIEEAGFAATTGYGYYGTDYDSPYEWRGGHSIPYEEMVKHYETTWRSITRQPGLPYILAVGSNWDNRPRAGANAAVITGKTPAKFRTMCENSLKYVDKRVGMALVEAWNEWGEGSFIEPDKQWGFALLDVVRDVFTDAPAQHVDYVPPQETIGRFSVLQGEELQRAREAEAKPDPPPPVLLRTVQWTTDEDLKDGPILKSWEFEQASTEGWVPYHVEPFAVNEGVLSTTVTLDDPQVIVDNVGVPIADLGCFAMRVRASEGAGPCEFFWSTEAEPRMSADKAFRFSLEGDGEWHTYQVTKQVEGKWTGTLKIIRLDIGRPGDRIEVDWVRLVGRKQ